jgi:hypothetical protein
MFEDGAMYWFGSDVDDQDKYVGCEWKTPTFLRHAPTRYVSYRNRGKLSRYL